MITITNGRLRVAIAEKGAEVQSVADVTTGREYLWQGDERYWGGRSPILFPAVGGLWDGVYRHEGAEYRMPKHGFVKQMTWTHCGALPGAEGLSARFALDFPDGAEGYPFPCRLEVDYRLDGAALEVTYRVTNLGRTEMFFQIGGHPALQLPGWDAACPTGGYLRLEGPEAATATVVRAGEQGCVGPERFDVPREADGLVPVSEATFVHEALIFDRAQLTGVTLLSAARQPVARVVSDAPVWLFWQPQGLYSPFVCAEPWYGLCDSRGYDGPLSGRPYISRLAAGAVAEGRLWRLEIC